MKKIAIFLSFFMIIFLTACNKSGKSNPNRPKYQGMTIEQNKVDSQLRLAKGNYYTSIENLVDIEEEKTDDADYYIEKNETFIIEVHISNPKDYEIQSFTLNGKKYANYMFKDGSTMELLLLETTAPSESGYYDYTIDAIKYIDGTEIKDADMSKGDKSIKVGIAFESEPSATVTTGDIRADLISLRVDIYDSNSLIKNSDIFFFFSDGEKIIKKEKINVGLNGVEVDHLLAGKQYEYGIVAKYDLCDGNGTKVRWLKKEYISTTILCTIDNVSSTKDSISFDVNCDSSIVTIKDICLVDPSTNEILEIAGINTREFEHLKSNYNYKIVVNFTYKLDGEDVSSSISASINTKTMVVPTLSISDEEVTDSTIKATLNINDQDDLCYVESIDLYKGTDYVASNNEGKIEFDSLDSYVNYKVIIEYSYDLNDGKGVILKMVEKEYTTMPSLSLISTEIKNTSAVEEGSYINIQTKLDNPKNLLPYMVVVNGMEYDCEYYSSLNNLAIDIQNNGQFSGGNNILIIEKIYARLDGKDFEFIVDNNNSASVFINVKLDVESIRYVDESFNEVQWCFLSDTIYLCIELDNVCGYDIEAINGISSWIKKDVNHYYKVEDSMYIGWNTFTLSTISYKTSNSTKVSNYTGYQVKCLKLESDEIKQITDSNELKDISGCHYYKLMNDICLDTYEFKNNKTIYGIFDGNNHILSNLSFTGDVDFNFQDSYGLFRDNVGIIMNVTIDNFEMIINNVLVEYDDDMDENEANGASDFSIGFITPGNSGIISNCIVNGNCFFKFKTNNRIALNFGFVSGSSYNGIIMNCQNSGCCDISASKSGDFRTVGSIVGDSRFSSISSCVNYGNIKINAALSGRYLNLKLGGIAGMSFGSKTSVIDCANFGKIEVESNGNSGVSVCIGGISGAAESNFYNCINCGELVIVQCYGSIGGIVGLFNMGKGSVTNSYSYNTSFDSIDQLNDKSFYTETLGWDETIWNLDNLDIENGLYPKLR